MSNIRFNVGDRVVRTKTSGPLKVCVGVTYTVAATTLCGRFQWLRLKEVPAEDDTDYPFDAENFRLAAQEVTPKIDLHADAWQLPTRTLGERITAQLWLFSQGLTWLDGSTDLSTLDFDYLIKPRKGGEGRFAYGDGSRDEPYPRRITLEFKGFDVVATWASPSPERAAELAEIRKVIEAATARLKILESNHD